MIYWYTGQPGHGKTLHAILRMMEFKAQGRRCFVGNVRDFDYEKTGMEKITPEQFCDWMDFLPDGAVCMIDEAYEHDMLPKRPPSAKVPAHVEALAKHRHRGLDFIFVCQSPDTQCDSFVRDLIERHIHVRRRFGTQFVHLREFDRFERNPEKAHPLVLKRTRLPKKPMGTYKSTELDTTERKVPWYYFAFGLGVPLSLLFMYYTFGGMQDRMTGEQVIPKGTDAALELGANGASATDAPGPSAKHVTPLEYIERYLPRIPSQPWSAPAYDEMKVGSRPPRLFCMAGDAGEDSSGVFKEASCTCLTEQGTRYRIDRATCQHIAMNGQYEPLFNEEGSELLGAEQQRAHYENIQRASEPAGAVIGYVPGERAEVFPRSPNTYETSTVVGPTGTL